MLQDLIKLTEQMKSHDIVLDAVKDGLTIVSKELTEECSEDMNTDDDGEKSCNCENFEYSSKAEKCLDSVACMFSVFFLMCFLLTEIKVLLIFACQYIWVSGCF